MGAITQIEANATAKDNFPQLVLLLTPLLSQPPMMARRAQDVSFGSGVSPVSRIAAADDGAARAGSGTDWPQTACLSL